MNNKAIRIIALLAALVMIICLASCGGNDSGIDLQSMIKDLYKTQKELGLEGKYERLADIKDGKVDSDLVGTWYSADKDICAVFSDNGILTYSSVTYDSMVKIPYTCITAGGKKIIAEEQSYTAYVDDSPREEIYLGFSTYTIKNGALFMVVTEDAADGSMTSFLSSLQVLYKADASGSITASQQAASISVKSVYGTWTVEETDKTVKIDKKGLHIDSDTYAVSIDQNGDLVVEKDGSSTVYSFNVIRSNKYEDGTKAKLEKKAIGLGFYFDGKDGNDKPNLASIMTDWHTEFGFTAWHYSGDLQMVIK